MTKIGYARVSSDDQSVEIQREQLTAIGCKRIFEEQMSGKTKVNRTEFNACIKFLEPGDTLFVTKLDRFARNTVDTLTLITDLARRGIKFTSLAEPWANTDTAAAELVLTVMAGAAQYERGRIRERQLEGIAKAKAAGRYRRKVKVTPEVIAALKAKGMGPSEMAKELNCGRTTVYRVGGDILADGKDVFIKAGNIVQAKIAVPVNVQRFDNVDGFTVFVDPSATASGGGGGS